MRSKFILTGSLQPTIDVRHVVFRERAGAYGMAGAPEIAVEMKIGAIERAQRMEVAGTNIPVLRTCLR